MNWLLIKILISNSYFPLLLLDDTRCDMNHKSWVTSRQFPRYNLAKQTVSTTLYCISIHGQNSPIEQLSEGLAKQLIKLDVILGIRQRSGFFRFQYVTYRHQRIIIKKKMTNKLAVAGILDLTWLPGQKPRECCTEGLNSPFKLPLKYPWASSYISNSLCLICLNLTKIIRLNAQKFNT